MFHYIVKKMFDVVVVGDPDDEVFDKTLTGYSNTGIKKVEGIFRVRSDHERFLSLLDTKFPMIVETVPGVGDEVGTWEIQHDQDAEDASDLKDIDNADSLDRAQRAKKRLKADLATVDSATVAELRPMVKDLIRTCLYLVRELEEK